MTFKQSLLNSWSSQGNFDFVPPQRDRSSTSSALSQEFTGTIEVSSTHEKLAINERGLVISCPLEINKGSFYLKNGSIDNQQLRENILFWDKLAYPDNNFISIGSGAEVEILISEGILFRPRANIIGGGDAATAFLKAHLKSFEFLDQSEPGKWSLARGEKSISFQDDQLEESRGLLLQFYDAIPVPDREVPIETILEFKSKRRSELLALRHHIDSIYVEILASPDKDLASVSALSAFDKALADHIKSSKEAPFAMRLSGLDIKFDWKAIGVGVAANAAAVAAGLPLATSLLAGCGLTALSTLSVTAGIKGRERSASPFEYVSRFNREML